jgi:hypothetical protein
VRLLVASGFLEIAPQSGDRTDYFIISDMAWHNSIRLRIEGFSNLKMIVEHGLNTFSKEDGTNRKLYEMLDWTDMMIENHNEILVKWKEKRISR